MTQKQMIIAVAVVAAAGVAYYFWQKRQKQQQAAPASTPTGGAPTVSNPGVLEQVGGVVNTAGDALQQLGDIFGS